MTPDTQPGLKPESFLERLKKEDLLIDHLKIKGDGLSEVAVSYRTKKDGIVERLVKKGQLFVSLPDRLAKTLPGSVLTPKNFLNQVVPEVKPEFLDHVSEILLGDQVGNEDQPIWTHTETDKDQKGVFTLRVFHGSTNKHALRISELAKEGFAEAETRAEYQANIREAIASVLKMDSSADLRIVEDCLASGETVMGVLAALKEKTTLPVEGKIRVDVAVATTQGIMLLKEFAQQNSLNLELNVGWLAYGLSEGVPLEPGSADKEHANYITYPEEILKQLPEEVRLRLEQAKWADGIVYVVGDMGDAGKSLPAEDDSRCPWNSFRGDAHGARNRDEIILPLLFDGEKPTILYFANGGYLMKAIRELVVPNIWANQVIFSAKRLWSDDPELGYGVLVDGISQKLLRQQDN